MRPAARGSFAGASEKEVVRVLSIDRHISCGTPERLCGPDINAITISQSIEQIATGLCCNAATLDEDMPLADADSLSTDPNGLKDTAANHIRHDNFAGAAHFIALLDRTPVRSIRRFIKMVHGSG